MHSVYCLGCHETGNPDFASPDTEVEFSAASVNRETACKACHIAGLVGSHPYHQVGANCGGACHAGWGNSLLSATPTYSDPSSGASFAAASSKATPASVLHGIHATPRWPAGVDTSVSACASCHAIAACNACHTGAIPATHGTHSATDQIANSTWTGVMGRGVVGGDQTAKTAVTVSNQCASAGCHDLADLASHKPRSIEDCNYSVGGNPEDPTGTNSAVTLSGAWRSRFAAHYSGSRMSYSNSAVASLTASFTGARVEVVSDRDPYRGCAEVLIDGVAAGTFDAYAPTTQFQAVVFTTDVEPGSHTVTVRPLGTKSASSRGTFVVVDGFKVLDETDPSIVPACSTCHADKVADHTP